MTEKSCISGAPSRADPLITADMPETTVPEGCVFVLGDDRTAANETGVIDLRLILGTVRFSFGR